MNAIVFSIGDELLKGKTLDTDSYRLSQELYRLGVKVLIKLTLPDSETDIITAIRTNLDKADIILITGGLGPTSDDKTLDAIAAAFNLELIEIPVIREMITGYYKKRNAIPPEAAYRMARIPKGAEALPNAAGVSPGVWLKIADTVIVAMPGVPVEMEAIFHDQVIPRLHRLGVGQNLTILEYCTTGVPESVINAKIEPLLNDDATVAYLPSQRRVLLRIELPKSYDPTKLKRQIEELLTDGIYADSDLLIEEHIGRLLIAQNQTLSCAESCTGGWIGQAITSVAGSSQYFKGGIIAYANEIKEHLLNVPQNLLVDYGAVSSQVAEAMALGAKQTLQSDWAVSVTGIAGPDGGTAEKPVGLIYIAVAKPDGKTVYTKHELFGNRDSIRDRTVGRAFDLLRKAIEGKI